MGKFVAILTGICGFGALGLFFVYIGWKEEATAHRREVENNLTYYTKAWQSKARRFTIQHSDIDVAGYPFNYKVTLFQPRIQMSVPGRIVQFSASYVTFEALGELPDRYYQIHFPQDVIVGVKDENKEQVNYYLHLASLPVLYVRTASSVRNGHFDELGVQLPDKLAIKIYKGQSFKQLIHHSMQAESPTWSYVPAEVHSYMLMLMAAIEKQFIPVPVEPVNLKRYPYQ